MSDPRDERDPDEQNSALPPCYAVTLYMSLSNNGPPNARWVPLCKVMQYACVPRVGDLVCYGEQTHGCGYPVISVTHLDGGKVVCEVEPEKWDDDIDGLMEVVEFWCKEGWQRKLPHEIFEA